MSLGKISTELDVRIASHLVGDSTALAALSETSKYYHTVAEPLLYDTIKIEWDVEFRIKQLLMTLLDKPQLATYIRRVTIGPTRIREPTTRNDILNRMRNAGFMGIKPKRLDDTPIEAIMPKFETYNLKVANAVEKVKIQDKEHKPRWIQDVFRPMGTPKDASGSSIDAVLALILTIADGIEHIALLISHELLFPTTRRILALQYPQGNCLQPCQQLKSIEIHSTAYQPGWDLFLETGAHRLILNGCRIEDSHQPLLAQSSLHTLKVQRPLTGPDALCNMLSMPAFSNVRRLVLDRVDDIGGRYSGQRWSSYDFRHLTNLLVWNFPNIESFSCINCSFRKLGNFVGFQSFRGLQHLQTLQVDLRLVMDKVLNTRQQEYETLLPPSIKTLKLSNINANELEMLFQKQIEHCPCGSDGENYTAACTPVWGIIPSHPALQTLNLNATTKFDSQDMPVFYYDSQGNATQDKLRAAVIRAAARAVSVSLVQRTGIQWDYSEWIECHSSDLE
jgi:hypothetical protein